MEKKILVVDDVIKNIQLMGSVLGKEGYAVSYATEGAKALEMAASERYDLILLDVMMPVMNGFEVCRRLKQDVTTRDIPVLFLTAKCEQDDIVHGLDQGAVDYLTKPFNTAELVARIRTHMALQQAQATIRRRNAELEDKNRQLEQLLEEKRQAMSEIKVLRGILPICAQCKKIRNDQGYWTQIEAYISQHSDAKFTHGICSDCKEKLYPFLGDD